jgi:nitroreductase
MKLQEAIDKRHSIREFEPKKVSRTILKKLIINASRAPSAANSQPWEFYIIDNQKIINKISREHSKILIKDKEDFEKLEGKLREIAKTFYGNLGNCKTIILVYMDKEKSEGLKINKLFSVAAAIENLMLSAIEEKLGTCWMGSFKGIEKEINKTIGVKNKELVTGVLIGYPKKEYKPLIRKKKKLNEILKFI